MRGKTENKIIMGRWNSRIGNDKEKLIYCVGDFGEETLNKNGKNH